MTNPEPEPEDVEYGILRPFITVTSKGGPHEDQAYVAGYEMGLLDARLANGQPFHQDTLQTVSIGQADLIAMRHGYRLEHRLSEDTPEWTFATFTRTSSEETP